MSLTVKVKFTDTTGLVDEEFFPYPAKHGLPQWYKDMKSYRDNIKEMELETNKPTSTVKRCMPFFDSLTAGYIIPTPTDFNVVRKDGQQYFQWSSMDFIEFHHSFQLETHKEAQKVPAVPKMFNPWGIVTPPGYSLLCVPPMNRDDSLFEIFSGVMDTDKFNLNGNFPFLMNDPDWTGIVPAGTPMAQVIPFKRESYKMEITGEEDFKRIEKQAAKLSSRFWNRYRDMFWTRKEYN